MLRNIFFSFAVDGRDLLKAYGGDKAAHASSNNELLGVQAYDQADIDGLCTLATVVISYAGQRPGRSARKRRKPL